MVLNQQFLTVWLKITHPIARGVGMGSSSHAIGTAQMVDDS
ncbi:LrgB family protein [Aquibacillus halophilus]|nr:LrgB family protein [Aquibacillus halophilus]